MTYKHGTRSYETFLPRTNSSRNSFIFSLYSRYPDTFGAIETIIEEAPMHMRQNLSDLQEVVEAVEAELKGSGSLLGYRAMHQRLVNHHRFTTTREVVLHALQIFDPEGVELRSRQRLRRRLYRCKGPNYLWHIDGYDKYSNHYD